MKKTFVIFLISLIFSACTSNTYRPTIYQSDVDKERKQHVKATIDYNKKNLSRLFNVSYKVLTNIPQEMCKNELTPIIGFKVWNNAEPTGFFDDTKENRELYEVLKDNYKLSNKLKISRIVKNSPAYRSGLRVGDILLVINGKTIEQGKNARDDFQNMMDDILKDNFQGSLNITIERKGKTRNIQFKPKLACDYPVIYNKDGTVNAFANQDDKIYINEGLMRFLSDDDELAFIISHELAHANMRHIAKSAVNNLLIKLTYDASDGKMGNIDYNNNTPLDDVLVSNVYNVFSRDFEEEADYVGLYYQARAGYNYNNAYKAWRKMSTQNPNSIYIKTSHPTSPSRYIALKETAKEISNKKVMGMPIVPNFKEPIY